MAKQAGEPEPRATPGRAASGPPGRPGLTGRRVGVYEILEEIGRGGMGVVYRARDRSLDREVAVKVLLPELSRDEEFERRFVREARAAARLDHPNIVQVYTAGRYEDVLFIVMQLVRGQTLAHLLRRRGRLPVREALKITRQAAEALGEAHKISLVHRDIKPNNIMIDEAGRVKIMDFGLMRSSLARESITRSGEFFGTPEYASPEQCETGVLDGRSDLYSLGAVLYEMLTGRMPYRADTPMALFQKILKEDPPSIRSLRPDVPPSVEALVRRMMAKKREDRLASAAEVVAAIDRILGGASRAVPAGPRRFPWVAAGLLAGALALASGVVLRSVLKREPPGPPPPLPVLPRPAAAPADRPERLRLVVFDLMNGIPLSETAWYEIALSDMLIASLSQQPYLEVPSRDMLLWKLQEMRLDGPVSGDNRRVLTQELGAHAYLSGTYYVQGGKIRVTLSCYRLPENTLAFPVRPFERSEKELFALVDEMAAEVARGLQRVAVGLVARLQTADRVRPVRELALAFRGGGPEPPDSEEDRDEGGRSLARKADSPAAETPAVKRREAQEAGVPREPAGAGRRWDGADAARDGHPAPEPPPPAAAPPAPPPGTPADEKAAAKDPSRDSAEALPAGREHARVATGKGPAEARRRAARVAIDEESLARAWYQNRQALEKYKFDKEQFETLSRILRSHFLGDRADELQKGYEADRVLRGGPVSGRGGPGNFLVDFVCPDCRESSPTFGKCPKCGRPLVFRVNLAVTGAEKKE